MNSYEIYTFFELLFNRFKQMLDCHVLHPAAFDLI